MVFKLYTAFFGSVSKCSFKMRSPDSTRNCSSALKFPGFPLESWHNCLSSSLWPLRAIFCFLHQITHFRIDLSSRWFYATNQTWHDMTWHDLHEPTRTPIAVAVNPVHEIMHINHGIFVIFKLAWYAFEKSQWFLLKVVRGFVTKTPISTLACGPANETHGR